MSITYGGVSLSHPTADALARWDRWRDRYAPVPLRPAGFDAPGLDHLPRPPFLNHDVREPRLNVLTWPTGASRWGEFRALCSKAQLAAIRTKVSAASGGPLDLVIGTTLDGGRQVRPAMYLLPPRAVFDGATDAASLYEITLVDDRWFWWQAASGTAPATASWVGLLSGLLSAAGVSSPTIDGVAAGYSTPNANRWGQLLYKPLPPLIDAACETVGARLVRGTDGTVRVISAANARTREDANWAAYAARLEVGGRATVSDFGPSLPEAVRVVFDGAFEGAAPATADVALAATAVYAGVTGQAGRVGVVHADPAATADAGVRSAYASQAAADWYRLAVSRVDAVFGGIAGWSPTGLEDRVEYEWSPPAKDHPRGRVLTRVVPAPAWDRTRYGGPPGCVAYAENAPPFSPTQTYTAADGVSVTDVWKLDLAESGLYLFTLDLGFRLDATGTADVGVTAGWLSHAYGYASANFTRVLGDNAVPAGASRTYHASVSRLVPVTAPDTYGVNLAFSRSDFLTGSLPAGVTLTVVPSSSEFTAVRLGPCGSAAPQGVSPPPPPPPPPPGPPSPPSPPPPPPGGPTTDCSQDVGSPQVYLEITGGPYAGTWPGTAWNNVVGVGPYAIFYPTGGGYSAAVALEFYGGYWHLNTNDNGTAGSEATTGGTCSPFELFFAGSSLRGATAVRAYE